MSGPPVLGRKNPEIVLIKNILTLFIISFVLFACSPAKEKQKKPPRAVNGVLDLRNWDLEQDGIVQLDGQWKFYWMDFIQPGEDKEESAGKNPYLVTVPAFWTSYNLDGHPPPVNGYATYSLTVLTGDNDKELALKLEECLSSYKLWVNNEAILQNGKTGSHAKQVIPFFLPQAGNFRVEKGKIEILMHTANFHYSQGGFYRSLYLGTNRQIKASVMVKKTFDSFLFGSLFFMALYHFILFFFRKNALSPFFFGLCCFTLAVRTILVNQRLLIFFFNISWFTSVRIEYLTVFLSVPAFLAFIYTLFPRDCHKPVLKVLIVLELCYVIIIFFPIKIIVTYMIGFHALLIITIIYIIYVLIVSSIRKREGALFLILGFVVLAFTIINDIFGYNQIPLLYTYSQLTPLGVMVFTIFQSLTIARRFTRTFFDSEKLSSELALKNLRLSKLDGLKDEFLANTSHELKTPLNGIIGIAESMINGISGELDDRIKYNLYMMVSSGRRLASLINDILDFSKLKQQDLIIRKKPVHIHGITDNVFALVTPLVQGRQVALVNAIDPAIPPVLGDEVRLQQILLNLVGNGIKYTREGTVEVTAEYKNGMVSISVSDSGTGIPDDKIDTIFNTFEQSDFSPSREYGGNGLGLSISKKLIELHGGTITVSSKLQKGTVFTFTLPVSPGIPEEQELKNRTPVLQDSYYSLSPDKMKDLIPKFQESSRGIAGRITNEKSNAPVVLVVDDEPVNRQVLLNHLSLNKYRVLQAPDDRKALEIIEKEGKPDLILLDIMMARSQGYKFCRKIRETYDRISLPIIMLTVNENPAELAEGYDAGVNDYITKPIFKSELLLRIEVLLELKEKTNSLSELNKTLEKKVTKRTEKLAQVNNKILKSIEYAKKIQQATMPDQDSFRDIFSEYFIIYKPCQIVGGDFYWLYRSQNHVLFALNDCTGHGVPGAFMAMIGNAVLNHIAAGICNDNPAEILAQANILIKSFLKQDNQVKKDRLLESATDDGMDTGICYFNLETGQLLFSGARIGLFYQKENQIIEIKGNKQSLGYRQSKNDFSFKNHLINFDSQTLFYITSDGYVTQPGGGENRNITFGNRRLQKILSEIYTQSLPEQKKRLVEEMEHFKKDEPQTDDITVIGFRVKFDL